jgi:hypothetical protein
LNLASANDVVPVLFKVLFPSWFAGFAFAAIGIGALVPAAVMSIGAANVFTRNFWKAYVNPAVTPDAEARVAKIASLVVKIGALLAILFLPTHFAIDLQLLGGMWVAPARARTAGRLGCRHRRRNLAHLERRPQTHPSPGLRRRIGIPVHGLDCADDQSRGDGCCSHEQRFHLASTGCHQ